MQARLAEEAKARERRKREQAQADYERIEMRDRLVKVEWTGGEWTCVCFCTFFFLRHQSFCFLLV